jgi:DNA polymerase-3 subunit delta
MNTRKAGMEPTEKPLLALYLFHGDDVLKHEVLLKRLVERISLLGDLTLNSQTFSAREIHSPQPLLDALNTMPFASSVRLVVVKDADALTKVLQEALASYIANPTATTVLVLTAKKHASTNVLYKAVKNYNPTAIVDCSSKKRSELPALIRNLARGEGVDITPSAITILLELVGTSTVSLNTEIQKLAAITKAAKRNRIDDDDVNRNVARLAEPKPWDLTDALAQRDAALCLRLIDRMHGITAIGLLAQCTTRIREILSAIVLKNRGVSVAQGLGKQEWQLKAVMRATTLYGESELESILKRTPEVEQKMKSGGDPDELLRLWILSVCTQKTATS